MTRRPAPPPAPRYRVRPDHRQPHVRRWVVVDAAERIIPHSRGDNFLNMREARHHVAYLNQTEAT